MTQFGSLSPEIRLGARWSRPEPDPVRLPQTADELVAAWDRWSRQFMRDMPVRGIQPGPYATAGMLINACGLDDAIETVKKWVEVGAPSAYTVQTMRLLRTARRLREEQV